MFQIVELVTGGWAVFIGIVLFICSMIMQNKDQTNRQTRYFRYALLSIILFQISDMLAWNFSSGIGITRYIMVRLTNFICYLLTSVILFNFSGITIAQIQSSPKSDVQQSITIAQKIQYALVVIMVFITILNLFTGCLYTFDDRNRFHLTKGVGTLGYYISCMISILLIHGLAWKYRKIGSKILLQRIRLSCLVNEIIGIIQIAIYGYYAFSMTFTIGAVLMFTGVLKQRAELQQEKQLQLEENRRNLAITRQQMLQLQIRPHFIYNTMAAIQAQILEDPENAYESIGIFSSFLRDTINFSRQEELITIEEELSFAEKYLELAEVRFGENLDIDFDIQATGFHVPPFTIQPLIENALDHGLKTYDHEGTICIRTTEESIGEKIWHVLEVEDNGIGMDPDYLNRQPDKSSTHIGLFNVKQRIEMTCQGKLEVISPVTKSNRSESIGPITKSNRSESISPVTQSNRPGTIIRIKLP